MPNLRIYQRQCGGIKILAFFRDFQLAKIKLDLRDAVPFDVFLRKQAKPRSLNWRSMKFASAIFLFIGLLGCKSMPSKELGKRSCVTLDSDKTLYTAESFSLALNASVREAAKDEGNRDLLGDFFPKSQLDGFLEGEFTHLFQTELENCGLNETIIRAGKKEPAELSVMRGPNSKIWGGSVMWQGHLFPQFTFEARTASYGIPEDFKRKEWQSAEAILRGTAWFEWTKGSFQFHPSGANKKILELLEGTSRDLVLFRGAGADSTQGETIRSFRNESTMFGKDPLLVLQGVFFTTSEADAKKWANPYLSSLPASPINLLELAVHDQPSLFVNFNRKNLDIAILINSKNPKTLDLLSTLTVQCTVMEPHEGANERLLEEAPAEETSPGETPFGESQPLAAQNGIPFCP